MKYYVVLLILFIATCGILEAQIQNYYTFSAGLDTYVAITGTPLTTLLGDNVLSAALDIGFTFPYGLNTYTQVKMSSNGFLYLGGAATNSAQTNSLVSTTFCPVVAPLWDNLNLTGGGAAYITEGSAPNRVFTCQWSHCQWNNNSTSTFNFQAKLYESGTVEFVYGSATGAPTTASASIGINMLPGGINNFLSVSPGINATASYVTESAAIGSFPGNGVVYDFDPPAPLPNNLACLSISGNLTPTAGTTSRYRITIRNAGTNPQTSYTVKIMSGTTVLASVPGPAIQPFTNAVVTVPWTPVAAGTTSITGMVDLTGDGLTVNDQSAALSVTVLAAGSTQITVGDGSQLARMPMDMLYRNGLYETIYQSTEIDTNCSITGVSFYNNFSSALTAKPTKIWMGITTQNDLSTGWIPSTELIQVFDGTVNYPTGQNTIHIDFDVPFAYAGNNLVMLVNRPMDTTPYSTIDRFMCQTEGSSRSRSIASSTVTYNPALPPATGSTLSGQFPRTTFSYSAGSSSPLFVISPAQKDWGTVSINSTNTQTFTMYNGGGAPLTLNSVNLTGSQMYTLSGLPAFPFVLAQGQTLSFSCTYHPTEGGTSSASIAITDNQTGARTEHLVSLQGICIDTSVYTLPYTQNFDAVTAPALPTDWSYYIAPTSNASLTTVTSFIVTPHSEPNSADLYNNGDNTGSVLLIAPPLASTIDFQSSQIRFWARGYLADYVLSVGVMSNPSDPASYVELQAITLPATWTEYTIALQNYAGTGKYITFKHGLGGLTRGMYVDDFVIETTMSSLQGIVYSTNNLPLENATVQLSAEVSTITNAAGFYTFSNVAPGSYNVSVSCSGYLDATMNIAIPQNGIVTQDFTLTPLPTISVTGMVAGSDAPAVGLPGAAITLFGINEYSATTDAQGMFTITGVATNQAITYSASHMGYISSAGVFVATDTNYDLGVIILTEIAYTPVEVIAAEATDNLSVSLTWQGPDFPDAPLMSTISRKAQLQFAGNRSLVGYQVWRLLSGQEANENVWIQLTPTTINQLNYTDSGWGSLFPGIYVWAIKAVYSGSVLSMPSFSNTLEKTGTATDDQVIANTTILGNHPNPFYQKTTISYSVKNPVWVKVEIFNTKGQLISILVDQKKSTGTHQVSWDGNDPAGHRVASGVYCYRMTAGNYQSTRTLLLK